MKKQVFGMTAALFALMLALFAGAYAADTSAAELSAANTAYAILYDDGTLVFQNSDTPESGKTVKKTYEVNLTTVYTWQSPTPWYKERESVRVVDFVEGISPTSTAYWFDGCTNLERMNNIQNLDTSNVTDMSDMFYGCSGLTALDLSHFDTANVTNMKGMFYACRALTALDVSHFDTSNVTDMSGMFGGCSGLTALDVSHFDTVNVTNMSFMFLVCSSLTALDVSHFDTSNVTNIEQIFSGCSGLTALDVSHFNTAKVKLMSIMFSDCSGLTALDVSHFDTSNVKYMNSMFSGCSGLTALDVSHFDTTNITSMYKMFNGCSSLTTLDLSSFDTTKVTDMQYVFADCLNLKTIYAPDKFIASSVEKSSSMFSGCTFLVGGNGTKYDESHTDKEYARIDTPSAPGYFTAKDAAPVTYAITAATPDNGKLSVTLSNPAAVTVAVSCFDVNGQFVSANLQSVQANAGTVTLPLSAGTRKACVMLFDSDYRPMCAPFAAVV